MDPLRNLLKEYLTSCQHSLKQMVYDRTEAFKIVTAAKDTDLPRLIASDDPHVSMLAQARLMDGKDIDTPEFYTAVLNDMEFSYDDVKLLACNDGQLDVLKTMFRFLGMEDEESQALGCQYNAD